MPSNSFNDGDSVAESTQFNESNQGDGSGRVSSEDEPILAKKETKDVFRLKILVLVFLMLCATGVAFLVYFYTENQEIYQFETQFHSDANKVLDAIGHGVETTFGALDIMATMMISHAKSSNDEWPFVTLPNFANHASKIRSMSVGMLMWSAVIVSYDNRFAWEKYAYINRGWVNSTIRIMETDPNYHGPLVWDGPISKPIYGDYGPLPYNESRTFAPMWQAYPTVPKYVPAYNWDWLSTYDINGTLATMQEHKAVLSSPYMLADPVDPDAVALDQFWADVFRDYIGPEDEPNEPVSEIMYPVVNEIDRIEVVGENYNATDNEVVALIGSSFYWRDIFKNILPIGHRGIVVVVDNECSASFTYQIDGPLVKYLGRGDHHDSEFDNLSYHSNFADLLLTSREDTSYTGAPFNSDRCQFLINVYPSTYMMEQFTTKNPVTFAIVAILIFVFTSIVFSVYDWKVERRQKVVMSSAQQSSAIVSSLFPSNVREQLYTKETPPPRANKSFHREAPARAHRKSIDRASLSFPRNHKKSFDDMIDSDDEDELEILLTKPIADLYPDTTVLFADIAGFTAWSSVRDPYQVFTLLETLYGAFDKTAKVRKVFKVETIGDSYVAVVGLPTPRRNHAVVMAKFADDIINKMSIVTHKLEVTLGPDTTDLKLRVGINSGPTTAGVLRGEKSRFQLFGDTVNTAARMESNGTPGRIQCSQKTADLIIESGKGQWLTKREDLVNAKGKGSMQTYWVQPASGALTIQSDELGTSIHTTLLEAHGISPISGKKQRLIEWNLDLFLGLLKDLVGSRAGVINRIAPVEELIYSRETVPLDELEDVIDMPKFKGDHDKIPQGKISPSAHSQLRDYLTTLAFMYKDNPFHNFEHASHVVMSTKKLLDKMVFPCDRSTADISLDPLARFAIVFGALIHDVDHQGVTNSQLVIENPSLANKYKNKCVAEQNSVDMAWDLLMQPTYADLQRCIFTNKEEVDRFRRFLVNIVLATDIFDKDLKMARENRWDVAFGTTTKNTEITEISGNRKATIFIEHLIQASDVVHTMQHWSVYQKWNYNLFCENFWAFKAGRLTVDPHKGWYEGELWFFDNYIIPLAKKLKVCGIFGASCDALLDFAQDNRLEWEAKGRDIVDEWLVSAETEYLFGRQTNLTEL